MTTDTSNGLTAAEIAALTPEGIANENANAPLGVEDIGYTQDRAPELGQERVQSDPTKREVVQRSPSDDVRNQIAARFKRGNEVAFDGDMTNPENLYGDFARAPVEEVDPEPSVVGEPLTPEAPVTPKRKLKVRGQDVELTDDEILAAAQKTLAGDSYLEDARKLLEEAKQIKAERAGRDRQHPDGQSSTQDGELDFDPQPAQTRHPAPDLKSVVEKIQFGDPDEAAAELAQVIQTAAAKQADEGHLNRLFNNDLAKSQKALAEFRAANPDLDKDPLAQVAIEKTMYDLYREEIVKLGLDEAQIPTDPKTLANWHRFYRVNGHAVSHTPDLLNRAKDRVDAWRGGPSKPAQQPQAPRREAPRVHVNVDRTARREAIPTQPTRSVAPRPDAQRAPTQQTGSDIVAQMRRARGQV
jgi:hypothetical protein